MTIRYDLYAEAEHRSLENNDWHVNQVIEIEENDDEDVSEHDQRAKKAAEEWVRQNHPGFVLRGLWREVIL